MYKQIDHEIKKNCKKMTKPKLYYAHITITHTHCYINSSTQYKGMYTSCSYHSLLRSFHRGIQFDFRI